MSESGSARLCGRVPPRHELGGPKGFGGVLGRHQLTGRRQPQTKSRQRSKHFSAPRDAGDGTSAPGCIAPSVKISKIWSFLLQSCGLRHQLDLNGLQCRMAGDFDAIKSYDDPQESRYFFMYSKDFLIRPEADRHICGCQNTHGLRNIPAAYVALYLQTSESSESCPSVERQSLCPFIRPFSS